MTNDRPDPGLPSGVPAQPDGTAPAPGPADRPNWPPADDARPLWAPPANEPRRGRLPSFGRVIAALMVLAIVFGAGVRVGRVDVAAPTGSGAQIAVPASLPPQFATYLEAWQVLQDHYVDPSALDPQALTYGSIDGLVRAVGDTDHTRFLTPAELADEHTSLSGSIVGVGAIMSTESGAAVIQAVIPGGPADRASLRGGDHVLAVDGTSTDGQTIDTIVKRIRGTAGTTVRLTILHAGNTNPIVVSIVREKVIVPAVSWALVPGTTIADVRLEEFSTGAAKQLVEALGAARKAGATAIVFDLRGNPGGYVDEAVSIASQFLPGGTVYQQRDRTGKTTAVPARDGGVATTIPLAVLVDNGTASAAEIVAGAIQDAKRGQIIGKTTFGTGTVLSEFNLKDGSALLVGTIEWLTREGRQIWKHGIVPDVTLDSNPIGKIVTPSSLSTLGPAGLATSGDLQLLKAIDVLRAH